MQRAFVCSPDAELVRHIVQTLPKDKISAAGSTDPRAIRKFAEGGAIDAVLVHEGYTKPTPAQLVGALRSIVPQAVFVLLTDVVRAEQDAGDFDAAVKVPVPGPVLLDRIVRARLAKARAASQASMSLEADVEIRSARLPSQSYYDILGVAPQAPTDAITRAYDVLSLRFHPDRVRRLQGTELEDKATALYLLIGEAYRTLRSRTDRMRYDDGLRRGELRLAEARQSGDAPRALEEFSDDARVKKALRTAQRALAARDYQMALVQLRFASNVEPDNSLIAAKVAEVEKQVSR